MNKVLFLVEGFSRHNVPNALCVESIIDEWKKQGKEMDAKILSVEKKAISFEEGYGLVYNYTTNKVITLLRKISKFFLIPIGHKEMVNLLVKKIKEIKAEYNFDTIVAVVNPAEMAEAAYRVKRLFPEVKYILYEIDPNSNRYKVPANFLEKEWKRKSIIWECRIYQKADCIIHMKSHKKHFEGEVYDPFKCKTQYLDIPSFYINQTLKTVKNDSIHLLYAGAFYPKLREPRPMVEVLGRVTSDFVLDIYTGNKMRKQLEELKKNYSFLNLHESVSQEEINRITRESDVLISIGNKDSDFLPSKTLVYMGTGKPIIHFYGDEYDTSLEYLRKYPRALLVNLEDDIEENAKKIVHFLSESTDEICDPALLLNLFYENTSAYTAEKMYSLINGEI